MSFEIIIVGSIQDVVNWSKKCEGVHTQQVCYSTFHTVLTQLCFGCEKIRTNMEVLVDGVL